jgi:uncharacterized membrane protein
MACNIGKADRILRVVFGIALIVAGFIISGTTGIIMGIVGLVLLITGLMGNCPAYSLFHINTCGIKRT